MLLRRRPLVDLDVGAERVGDERQSDAFGQDAHRGGAHRLAVKFADDTEVSITAPAFGIDPHVRKVEKEYKTGVRLSRKALDELEQFIQRMDGLKKWFVVIPPASPTPDEPIP